jgi:hypothetical protein
MSREYRDQLIAHLHEGSLMRRKFEHWNMASDLVAEHPHLLGAVMHTMAELYPNLSCKDILNGLGVPKEPVITSD